MSAETDAPWERGATFFNGGTIPPTVLPSGETAPGANYEGREYEYWDSHYGTGLKIKVRVVRNSALYNILPGQLVDPSATAGYFGTTVLPGTNAKGVVITEDVYSFPADEFLPPAGVPPGDLFYIVTFGPALLLSTKTGVPTTALLQKVVSCTASATTDGNAGGIIAIDLTAATTGPETTIANQINNAVGRAMSALTSSQTNTPVLVGIGW